MKESIENHYDVIIIGAGLGGLTAAAWLAKAGKKVLLVEKEKYVGGYFGPLMHHSYYFNNGPRLLLGCNADGPYGPGFTYALLEKLGVQHLCEFIPIQPFTTVRLPEFSYQLWSGRDAFVEGMRSVSPGSFGRLPDLLKLCGEIHQAGMAFCGLQKPWELAKIAGKVMMLLRYQNATMKDVMTRFIPEVFPRNLVGAIWPHMGLSPDRASFIFWALLMASYIDEGAHFCKGGLYHLPKAVASAFTRDGGDLLTETTVAHILLQDRIARGVELSDGRQFFAPEIIANIDPREVFGNMLARDERPRSYLQKMDQMELSIRGITLIMVTDLDLPAMGFGYDSLVFGSMDMGGANLFSLTVTDAVDPSLAPTGQHLVSIYSSLPPESDSSTITIEQTKSKLMKSVEQAVPGLRDHLLLSGSSDAPEGFVTHIHEPIYGWSFLPRQSGVNRLSPRTPIKGITLAGQWTRPGPGTVGVIVSGLQAAKKIVG